MLGIRYSYFRTSHGTVLPWEPGPHLRSSSRHTTALWTRTCQPSGDIALRPTLTTSLAAGADTLEELFELLKALIECFDKVRVRVRVVRVRVRVI
jgi:hypothetical protein